MISVIRNTVLVTFMLFLVVSFAHAQSETMENVKTSLRMGSSKELVKYIDNMVEIGIDGNQSTYSKSQAEFVLKEFFSKNPVSSFEYIHKGSSQGGLQYAIGKYQCPSGSYRVLVRVKESGSVYKIYNIDFTKE